MRTLHYLILSFLVFACSNSVSTTAFSFYDSHGVSYRSDTAGVNAKKEYELIKEPKLILIATSSASLKQFAQQMEVIYKTDAEKLQYMYVVANKEKEDHSGYYTSTSVAKNLIPDKIFKINIYDEHGKLIVSSNKVISADNLKLHLTKGSSGR